MKSSSAQSRDTDEAIQKLLDLMRIPAENRAAVSSDLSFLIRRLEVWNRRRPIWERKRHQRILRLRDNLLKELDALPPSYYMFRIPHSEEVRSLMKTWKIGKRPAHRPRGSNWRLSSLISVLYRMQKEYGGRLLTLTRKIPSGEASGSLPTALEIFHGLVPSIIPARPSYSTLNRMRGASFKALRIRLKRQRYRVQKH